MFVGSDDHNSEYDLEFIMRNQLHPPASVLTGEASIVKPQSWNLKTLEIIESQLHYDLSYLLEGSSGEDNPVREVVSTLIRYGIVFIENVPATTDMTEMTVRRLFPIMKTLFGQMFTFSDAPDHADTAYSKLHLESHTDNTYFTDAAGILVLHCLEHRDGEGGENFFVDGLRVVEQLRSTNRQAFETLKRVPVPAEYLEDGQHHRYSAPIINVDPVTDEVVQLRLNVYDRAAFDTIAQQDMSEFYTSFLEFLRLTRSPENVYTCKLNPGTVVLFDNWRVFHGRMAYTGHRTMTGCYVQRTDFQSKARILGLIN